MIFDKLKNCKMYYGLNPRFEQAFAFVQKAIDENYNVGRYEIDGKNVYALVQSYDSKQKEDSIFEGHRNYIDIQCVIEGTETMGCMEISNAVVNKEYNPEIDAALYDKSDIATYSIAGKGDFCIFYPHDIHSPGVAWNNIPSKVKKIVVKVHI